MPETFRQDLAALETLPTPELRQHMQATLDSERLARYDALLAANAADTLDDKERQELAMLRTEADRLMFRKAYAALLLKWRGQRIPTLDEIDSQS